MTNVAYVPRSPLFDTYDYIVVKNEVKSKFTGETKTSTFIVQLDTRTTHDNMLNCIVTYKPCEIDKYQSPCQIVGDMPKKIIQDILNDLIKQLPTSSCKNIDFLRHKSEDEQVDINLKADIHKLETAYRNTTVPFGWYIDGMCRIIKICIAIAPGDLFTEEITHETEDMFYSPYSSLVCDMLLKLIDQ